MRLYIMACSAALLASLRVNHQPIKIKESIPTPSQPTNKRKRLFEDTNININNKNIIKQAIKDPFFGSEDI